MINAPEPMNIYEAIEVIKILEPHVNDLIEVEDGIEIIGVLSSGFERDKTQENIGRLIALMTHRSYDEVTAEYRKTRSVENAFYDLVRCFSANPIPDLINAGYVIGLLDKGWPD